jgi:uncharacterized protein (UPF0261 family)
MKIKTIKHADVRGKELTYLEIENNKGKKVLINVGDKTYKSVTELAEEEAAEKPDKGIEEDPKKK